ncbi:MAG: hypothetical protein IJ642_04740 [Oscillospiraceae bacterium]|nr:hypothetical protein [Oscillospiraceae bacterium]
MPKIKKEKESESMIPALIFLACFILSGISDIVFSDILKAECPVTYIGMEALHQIHDYLILYFWGKILIFFLPALPLIIIGIVSYFRKKDEQKDFSIISFFLVIGLILCVIFSFSSYTERNGFEVQMKQKQYSGTSLMKTAAMIMDIEKDLQAEETQNFTASCSFEIKDYGYSIGGRGSSYHISMAEYALKLEEAFCQVSGNDRDQIENLYGSDTEYEIAVYQNSGLMASIDGNLLSADFNPENLFTLTYENDTIYRTTHSLEKNFKNLTLIQELNGKQIGQIVASDWTEKFSPPVRGAGTYTAYLTMTYNGWETRVSNEICYEFDEESYTEPEPEPCPELTGTVTETEDGLQVRIETYSIEFEIPKILNLDASVKNTDLEENASGYTRNIFTGKGQFFHIYMDWEKLPYLKEMKWRITDFEEYLQYENPDSRTELKSFRTSDGTEGWYLIYEPDEINADNSDYYRTAAIFPYADQEYIWIEMAYGGDVFAEDALAILESLHFMR